MMNIVNTPPLAALDPLYGSEINIGGLYTQARRAVDVINTEKPVANK
jgi:hypothetical protein